MNRVPLQYPEPLFVCLSLCKRRKFPFFSRKVFILTKACIFFSYYWREMDIVNLSHLFYDVYLYSGTVLFTEAPGPGTRRRWRTCGSSSCWASWRMIHSRQLAHTSPLLHPFGFNQGVIFYSKWKRLPESICRIRPIVFTKNLSSESHKHWCQKTCFLFKVLYMFFFKVTLINALEVFEKKNTIFV